MAGHGTILNFNICLLRGVSLNSHRFLPDYRFDFPSNGRFMLNEGGHANPFLNDECI